MKAILLLTGTFCVLGSAAQNKYPALILPKKKNVFAEMQHPSVTVTKPDVFILPNGNKLIGNAPGQMPCIIPDMREYPNFRGYKTYTYHGLGKMPNVQEK